MNKTEKKLVKRYINGENNLHSKIEAIWVKHKKIKDECLYTKFLCELMKDEMDVKEYGRLKTIIRSDTIED